MVGSIASLPGPQGLPLLGSLLDIIRDPLGFHQGLCRDFYGIVPVRLPAVSMYVLTDPALVESVLVGKHRDLVKDRITRELYPLVGKGLVTNDGDSWRRQRKLAAQPFSPRQIEHYADVMVECAQRAFATYEHGSERDFHSDIMALTLEIVGRTLLGFDTKGEAERVARALEELLPYLAGRLQSFRALLPPSFPSRSARRFRAAKRDLDAVVSQIISRARKDRAGDHLLARLVRMRDEQGGMSEQMLADEAITMLLAGHETTALTIMFAVYLLSRHPQVARSLRAELHGRLSGRTVRHADLGRLPLLTAVVKETLRLYPAAPMLGREVAVPIILGDREIARGTQLIMSPFAMQRDARHFVDPERFRPERFLGDGLSALPKFAYYPFGGGPRVCIGQHFATMEAQLLLAVLLQQMELQVPESFELKLRPVITLRSEGGLPVRVNRRDLGARSDEAAARAQAAPGAS